MSGKGVDSLHLCRGVVLVLGWHDIVAEGEHGMSTLEIQQAVLDKMIHRQKKQLQDLLKLRGQTYNPVTELCQEVGIQKKFLAYGLVLQEKGNITVTELARRLDVKRSTIYDYWPEVVRAIKSM